MWQDTAHHFRLSTIHLIPWTPFQTPAAAHISLRTQRWHSFFVITVRLEAGWWSVIVIRWMSGEFTRSRLGFRGEYGRIAITVASQLNRVQQSGQALWHRGTITYPDPLKECSLHIASSTWTWRLLVCNLPRLMKSSPNLVKGWDDLSSTRDVSSLAQVVEQL